VSTPQPDEFRDRLRQAKASLEWLAGHGALRGVAEIIAERQRMAERHAEAPTAYEAESALGFGEYARAGALIAAELDQDDAE
jgi:hypothetical protein